MIRDFTQHSYPYIVKFSFTSVSCAECENLVHPKRTCELNEVNLTHLSTNLIANSYTRYPMYMMKRRVSLGILCFLLSCLWYLPLVAQVPANQLGLNPLSLKWRQIKTDKVQVVFPRNLEKQGQRVANIVHYLWEHSNPSIGDKKMPVTIFLQNQTTAPNGFVSPGPFRSEFYVTPPQFLFNGASNWLDMLVIHEYRHVQQFSNSRRGITGLTKTLLGSWPWGGIMGAALPRWYFEGDAVVSETALSNTGRGRQPSFEMEYRSLILNNINYGYEKASAGSLKDFVPDHYRLGYYMIGYGRRKFGEQLWSNVMQDAVKYKRIFYPFSRNLKRRTGMSTPRMYKKVRAELDSVWKAQDESIEYVPTQKINQKKKRTVINYEFPHFLGGDTIIVQKSGYNEIRSYYRITPDGREKLLTLSGINPGSNASLSISGGKLCWAETGFHARWGLKNYSVIKIYDLKRRRKKRLTSKSRYFAPALSPDGSKIITVETNLDLSHTLVVLNSHTGEVIKKLPNPDNNYYVFPKWVDEENIVVVRQKTEQNQLQQINISSGQTTNLTKPTSTLIAYPFAHGEHVYFTGAYTGIHNIFAVKKGENQLYQVSSSKLGAFYPAVSADGKTLVMSEFSPKGYNVTKMALNPAQWKPYNENKPIDNGFYQILSEQEGGSIFDKIPSNNFQVKKYNKWSGIINPHSLLFSVLHPNYGLRLLSDNKFSTLSAEISGLYNTNERRISYGASLNYAELYPIITGGYQRLNRSRISGHSSIIRDTTITFGLNRQEWQEDRFTAGIELPVNFSGGNNFNSLRLNVNYHYIRVGFDKEDIRALQVDTLNGGNAASFARENLNFEPLQKQSMQAFGIRLRTNMQQQRAVQHIKPRFWFYLDLWYRSTFNTEVNAGNVFLGLFNLYLPGLAKNHSFYVTSALQNERFRNAYKFSNFFPYSRGYGSWFEDNAFKYGLNYTFPLWYPDLPIASLLFIKRIKANLFYDFTGLNSNLIDAFSRSPSTRFMRSTGVELTFDVRAVRLLEIDLGVRYSYLLDANLFGIASPHKFDFLLLRIGI